MVLHRLCFVDDAFPFGYKIPLQYHQCIDLEKWICLIFRVLTVKSFILWIRLIKIPACIIFLFCKKCFKLSFTMVSINYDCFAVSLLYGTPEQCSKREQGSVNRVISISHSVLHSECSSHIKRKINETRTTP